MNLSLLAPLALAAAVLVGAPVLLHLIDQRKVPLQDFPALRFLRQARKRLRKQSRIRDRWLLLARLLALLLLVLAAAAPLLRYEEEVPAGAELRNNVVFLLDRSLSMGYRVDGETTVFDRARERMATVLSRLPDEGRVGLILFDRWPEDVLGGLQVDHRRALRAAEEAELSYAETDLRAALLAGVRALLASPEGGGDLYLLTDLTDSSLSGDVPLELPEHLEGRIRLVVPRLLQDAPANRTLAGATVTGGAESGAPVTVTAHVRAEGAVAPEAAVSLHLGEEMLSRGFVDAGAAVDKPFTVPTDGDLAGDGRLSLDPDALPADDAWYFRLSQRRQLRVLVVDGDPGMSLGDGESFFLERALAPQAGAASRITAVVTGPGAFADQDLSQVSVVFLANVADPAQVAAPLRAFVERGGGLFITAGDNVSPERYNRALRELLPASLGETIAAAPDVTGEKPPTLGFPPVGHPIFRVFREAGAEVFGRAHFYKMMPTSPSLKEDGDVLLKLSTGLPALLGRRVGRGRVLFFASTLDRGWTDLPLKTIYLPFVQESVHWLAGSTTDEGAEIDLRVGQPVPLAVPASTGRLTVHTPDGQAIEVEDAPESGDGADALSRRVFRQALVPGHYQVSEAQEGEAGAIEAVPRPDLGFCVNVADAEARLTPLADGRLQALVPGVAVVIEGQAEREATTVTVEREERLAHPLLWLVLLGLVVEGVMTVRRHGVQGSGDEAGPEEEAGDAAA